jgi:quinol monooxygenase YgiN
MAACLRSLLGIAIAQGLALVEFRLQIRAQPVHATEMVRALRSIMLPARAERGFISSRIYQEVDSPESLCYVEEWASLEPVDQQVRSRRFASLLALMETAPQAPALEVREISETRGLDYISTIRLGSDPHATPVSETV